jgi:hypothetical protein
VDGVLLDRYREKWGPRYQKPTVDSHLLTEKFARSRADGRLWFALTTRRPMGLGMVDALNARRVDVSLDEMLDRHRSMILQSVFRG